MKFKEYKGLDLAGLATEVLNEWDAHDTFHKSISTREGHPTFVFYEGPPSANGMPGIHHVMARTIKDVFCRYKTQQGYLVHRKAGWDTHGLPVELGVEKKLGITKEDIGRKISIEEYNRACREAVMEFTGMWEELTRKMGYWVNMDDPTSPTTTNTSSRCGGCSSSSSTRGCSTRATRSSPTRRPPARGSRPTS